MKKKSFKKKMAKVGKTIKKTNKAFTKELVANAPTIGVQAIGAGGVAFASVIGSKIAESQVEKHEARKAAKAAEKEQQKLLAEAAARKTAKKKSSKKKKIEEDYLEEEDYDDEEEES